jgi:hypothetical protein
MIAHTKVAYLRLFCNAIAGADLNFPIGPARPRDCPRGMLRDQSDREMLIAERWENHDDTPGGILRANATNTALRCCKTMQ